jgi:hypothetical protein
MIVNRKDFKMPITPGTTETQANPAGLKVDVAAAAAKEEQALQKIIQELEARGLPYLAILARSRQVDLSRLLSDVVELGKILGAKYPADQQLRDAISTLTGANFDPSQLKPKQ